MAMAEIAAPVKERECVACGKQEIPGHPLIQLNIGHGLTFCRDCAEAWEDYCRLEISHPCEH
jgi:hypothetical protein